MEPLDAEAFWHGYANVIAVGVMYGMLAAWAVRWAVRYTIKVIKFLFGYDVNLKEG